MDEDALMRQAAKGDTEAFGRLVRMHQQCLVRFAHRMLGDRESAEDAAQEAFLRVWRTRASYQPQGCFRAFLLRITRNVCLDRLRSAYPSEPLDRVEADDRQDVAGQCEARTLADAVRRAVTTLPEPQRAVFVLSHFEGFSYAETAAILGCPVGTVASRKRLAVESVRRRLRPWMEEE